ncbi:hypothetical protein GH714_005182 [Hevea brasiliensis]|uniref:DUF4216 domain-containing protein n=1 Tax=Hevea brasiliensis TaxID=3981 RepID=A0A6A6LEN0_HEVBR|nr:hypothetical protein GH714_005182 [Hevea brasiliensis]
MTKISSANDEVANYEWAKGIKINALGFTLVNLSKLVHIGVHVNDEPFVFASQVQQVFYIKDVIKPYWHVIIETKPRDFYEMGDELTFDYDNALSSNIDGVIKECDEDINGANWIWNDIEGVAINEQEEEKNDGDFDEE